jgi:hypothetical protein
MSDPTMSNPNFPRPSIRLLMAALVLAGVSQATSVARADDSIQFLGMAELPPGTTDHSGLTDTLQGGVPHNQLGGLSALEYSGRDNLYYVLPDRGPGDGSARYHCRWQMIELKLSGADNSKPTARVVGTTLLTASDGKPFVGNATAFDPNGPDGNHRLDPEGLRRGPSGSIFISDEYGPYVIEFDSSGRQLRSFEIPARYLIAHPAATKEAEVEGNTSGRVTNGGMEGLAISTDGKRLYALMQVPLLQDSQRTKKGKVKGLNCRLLELDIATGKATREFLYPLDHDGPKNSEILAIDDHQFLVIERDGKLGKDSEFKRVMKIDIADATDTSAIARFPHKKLPKGVTPVRKSTFIDLLDPRYGLAGPKLAEKQEGLAWGPALPDGRKVLWMCVDNDFKKGAPCQFYAFAIRQGEAQAQR